MSDDRVADCTKINIIICATLQKKNFLKNFETFFRFFDTTIVKRIFYYKEVFKMKKIISLTLALVLIIGTLCVFPVGASAKVAPTKTYKGFEYYELSDGGIRIIGYDSDKSGTVTIPETIKGKKVVSILQFSTLVNDKTTKLVIPRYVKTITYTSGNFRTGLKYSVAKANKTFCSYKGMLMTKSKKTLYAMPYSDKKTITVPSTVVNIRARAFYSFAGGSIFNDPITIKLPKGLKKIGAYAFMGIDELHRITLPSGLKSIGRSAFYDSLIKYNKPGEKTVDYMTKIRIPKSVTTIGRHAIGYCHPGEDTGKVSCLIKGAKGSAAEAYAKANKFEFKAI